MSGAVTSISRFDVTIVLVCGILVSFTCVASERSRTSRILSPESLPVAAWSYEKPVLLELEPKIDFYTKLPLILWWTPATEDMDKRHLQIQCPRNISCLSSRHPKLLNDPRLKAVIIDGPHATPDNFPLPRKPDVLWGLYYSQSLLMNPIFNNPKLIKLFNFTSTYRRESDLPLTSQHIFGLDYLLARPPVPTEEKNRLRQNQERAAVVYMQSNCDTPSDRHHYVEQLMHYIHIDAIGNCHQNQDIIPRHLKSSAFPTREKILKIVGSYKFHISIEDNLCEDYMTELLYRPLYVGSVPIYLGSPKVRVKEWIPSPNSVIFIEDFASPEALAEHLRYLDKNDTAYNELLQYKKGAKFWNRKFREKLRNRQWRTLPNNPLGYYRPEMFPHKMHVMHAFECHICAFIHQKKKTTRIAAPDHIRCPMPWLLVESLDQDEALKDRTRLIKWLEYYHHNNHRGRLLHDLIVNNRSTKHFDNTWNEYVRDHYVKQGLKQG